ncbi:uncharacterized protein YALI1_C22322g [Yarrowia lipolytica]|uniref:Uncharacterized protein n=1 Tax=Yarrowia lipolytica TaxID=4952 RepID=A0A1D8NBB6_YARLL|nr:hypothetical protein YALI1_C22322g [Yarrowia lipolytica]
MDYHNPHSDLFQMATEPWCDDYVAQYGNSIQYPVTNSFAYNLPYDDLTQHHNHNQHQQQLVSQPQSHVNMLSHFGQQPQQPQQQQQQQHHHSHGHVTPQTHHNYSIDQPSPLQQHHQNSSSSTSSASSSSSHVTNSHHHMTTPHSQNQTVAAIQPPPSNYQLYSSVQVPYEDVYLDTSSSAAASDYLLTQPYMEAVTSATTSPSDYDTPHNASSSASSSVSVASRKQPESRMSQPELFSRMGLSHDPEEARNRENRVLSLLKSRGFKLGEQTWIRDTTPAVRQEIVDFIHASTVQEYGYSKYMIEVVIRRACYHLMQGRLRRIRRARKSKGN